jgi:hypothetical protein
MICQCEICSLWDTWGVDVEDKTPIKGTSVESCAHAFLRKCIDEKNNNIWPGRDIGVITDNKCHIFTVTLAKGGELTLRGEHDS